MTTPVLHLLAGPNGAGKTTLYDRVLGPVTHLPFVNADRIAAERWPGDEAAHAYDASAAAAVERDELIAARRSFVTETVFSHPSKVALVQQARAVGYLVALHVVAVPVELSVVRVRLRVEHGGHHVPEDKVRARHQRLWAHVAQAVTEADAGTLYDNSDDRRPYRVVARWSSGRLVGDATWPAWLPDAIRGARP